MAAEAAEEPPALRIAPPPFLSDPALQAVLTALGEARIVGGAVRDTLAGRPVADIDLATPLLPAEASRRLAAAGVRVVATGLAHGTVSAVFAARSFEITTLRRDLATDGRHATVAFTTDWRADAARRDFTINALSLCADGAVFDYFGGIADLGAGRVRFIGCARARIAEDYLRILRFFRFYAGYGRGPADAEALAAIRAGLPGLARLSAERVWSELRRLLAIAEVEPALVLMQQSGVLAALLPGVPPPPAPLPERLCRLLAAPAPADPLLRLAALVGAEAAAAALRLRLGQKETALLLALVAQDAPPETADDAALRRALAETPRMVLRGRAWLCGRSEELRRRLQALPQPEFPVHGRDLRAAGVAEGPELGALLARLRRWWLDNGCVADRDTCLAALARLRRGW